MAHIELSKIVEEFKLDTDTLAKILFPDNKFPKSALDRILKDQTKLDSDQIAILADYLAINVQDLYSFRNWRGGTFKNNVLTLTRGKFKANFNIETFKTTLLFNTEVIDEIVLSSKSISLYEYVEMLDKKISEYINK